MGAESSRLTGEEIDELKSETSVFSSKEIKKLYERFKILDRSKNGTLSSKEIKLIPELAMNPLCNRIIEMFLRNGDEANFRDFVKTLAVFSPKAQKIVKQRCVFFIYDVDGDGYICMKDLVSILKDLCGQCMKKDDLETIAKTTIQDAIDKYNKETDNKEENDEKQKLRMNFDVFAKSCQLDDNMMSFTLFGEEYIYGEDEEMEDDISKSLIDSFSSTIGGVLASTTQYSKKKVEKLTKKMKTKTS